MFYFTSFVSEGIRKDETFGDIMIQAILMERIGFIELLLMNGFVMKTFLTVEKLAVLYNEQVCIQYYALFYFTEFYIPLSRRVIEASAISSS